MFEQLENDVAEARKNLEGAASVDELQEWWRLTLGRKGSVQLLSRGMGKLAADERPAYGKRLNEVKTELETAFEQRSGELKQAELEHQLAAEAIDVTLPGRRPAVGSLHPSTRIMRDMCRIFGDMGFQIYRSPDVVTDRYNFEYLNMPPEHPARDMQDTFYTTDPNVLLAHPHQCRPDHGNA